MSSQIDTKAKVQKREVDIVQPKSPRALEIEKRVQESVFEFLFPESMSMPVIRLDYPFDANDAIQVGTALDMEKMSESSRCITSSTFPDGNEKKVLQSDTAGCHIGFMCCKLLMASSKMRDKSHAGNNFEDLSQAHKDALFRLKDQLEIYSKAMKPPLKLPGRDPH